MMTEAELNAELADLADVLALAADAEPWSAAWASRQSLLMRQNELFDAAARLGDEFELEVQIAGPVTQIREGLPGSDPRRVDDHRVRRRIEGGVERRVLIPEAEVSRVNPP